MNRTRLNTDYPTRSLFSSNRRGCRIPHFRKKRTFYTNELYKKLADSSTTKQNVNSRRLDSVWHKTPDEKLRNYKALDVYVIKSDHKIQRVGKDSHSRWNRKTSAILKDATFPDNLDISFQFGQLTHPSITNVQDQQVPSYDSLLERGEDADQIINEEQSFYTKETISSSLRKSSRFTKTKLPSICNVKDSKLSTINEAVCLDTIVGTGEKFKQEKQNINDIDTSKSSLTEKEASYKIERCVPDFFKINEYSNQASERAKPINVSGGEQLVPETPDLSKLKTPLLGVGVHQRKSGFAVPETPLFTNGSDTHVNQPGTPLFRGGLHFQINCYQVPETPSYATSIAGPKTPNFASCQNDFDNVKTFSSHAHIPNSSSKAEIGSSVDVSGLPESSRAYRQQKRTTLVNDPKHL